MGRLLTKDTAKRSAVELANAIESAGGGISASIGNNTFGTSVGALKTVATHTNPITSGLENMAVAAGGAAVAYGVGSLFDAAV